jgi:hypothetical protein
VLPGVLVGALLRLWGLSGQLLLDDEWHTIEFVSTRDASFLFTHFSFAGANSILLNLYLRGVLVVFGWTETTLTVGSVVAGILVTALVPAWIWRRFGPTAALTAGLALAISPFLVFLSRMVRGYALAMLFEQVALISLCEWRRRPDRRLALGFVISGGLAVIGHLSTLLALGSAVAATACLAASRSARAEAAPSVRPTRVLLLGVGLLACVALLAGPALLSRMPVMRLDRASFSLSAVRGVLELLAGSRYGVVVAAYVGLVVAGIGFAAAKKVPAELVILGASALGPVVAELALRAPFGQLPAVFARYALPLFVVFPLAAGLCFERLASRAGRAPSSAAAVALAAGLFAAGPLPPLYGRTNNFTKHPAYQFDYQPVGKSGLKAIIQKTPRTIMSGEEHAFYRRLATEPGGAAIIEYPFLLGGDSNGLYFYQQLHGRPVLAGYYHSGVGRRDRWGFPYGARPEAEGLRRPPSPGYISGDMTVDHVLGRVDVDPRIHLKTTVDVADPIALSHSGARYLVLHVNLLAELFPGSGDKGRSVLVDDLARGLAPRLGAPIVADQTLTVFDLRGL